MGRDGARSHDYIRYSAREAVWVPASCLAAGAMLLANARAGRRNISWWARRLPWRFARRRYSRAAVRRGLLGPRPGVVAAKEL